VRFFEARFQRLRIRQHDEREAVAMIGGVGDIAAVERPRVAAGLRIAMKLAQVFNAMPHATTVLIESEVFVRHRVVENEPRARHEMPRRAVVDRAVVLVEMIKTARRVHAVRVIERQGPQNVIEQELTRTEVGIRSRGRGCIGHISYEVLRASLAIRVRR